MKDENVLEKDGQIEGKYLRPYKIYVATTDNDEEWIFQKVSGNYITSHSYCLRGDKLCRLGHIVLDDEVLGIREANALEIKEYESRVNEFLKL